MTDTTEVKTYNLHVTSSDSLGMNLIENIIELANKGAVLKPGTTPFMRFPHSVSMEITTDTPPTPSAMVRVFDKETNKELFAAFVEPVSAIFSLDTETTETVVDKTTNGGVPWTKEQLLAMDWETEFKEVCKAVGITGRSKDKMIKEYLAKFE
jgi:hypothetical protein